MPFYEHTIIARQDISQAQVDTIVEKVKSIITENGGSVGKSEYWGLRSFAYRMKKNRKGHYAFLNIDSPHAAVAEAERQLKLDEDVLRFLTIKVDELEEGPSAMMKKDDRGPRHGGRGRGDRDHRGGRDDRNRDDRPKREDKEARTEEGS